jgi:hypothetical protein
MSRGPGRIERAVELALRDADRSYTVEELAQLAYPGIAEVEKKHRVVVLRALNNVANKAPLWFFDSHEPPWRLIVMNRNSVRSYAHGLLRAYWYITERSLEQVEMILSDPEVQAELLEPGCAWWTEVEIHKAEVEDRALRDVAEAAGLVERDGGCTSMKITDMSPEMLACGDHLTALRTYRYFLNERSNFHPMSVLGKFEPPGSRQFEYAMSFRE